MESQSLLNQGNIQIELKWKLKKFQKKVSIPFKSGKYSNFINQLLEIYSYKFVSIPFKSGKYSNQLCWFLRFKRKKSQSLLNQGNIQILRRGGNHAGFTAWVSIPFKSGKYSNTTFYNLLNLLIYFDDFP